MSWNIQVDENNEGPWSKRHKEGNFKGLRLPFGALIDFMPDPKRVKEMPKADSPGVPGIFLGYVMEPGGKFSGDYEVVDLKDLVDENGKVLNQHDLAKAIKKHKQVTATVY